MNVIATNCTSVASILISIFSVIVASSALAFAMWNAHRERRHRESSQLAGMLLTDKIAQLNGFYYPLQGGLTRLFKFKQLILESIKVSPQDEIGKTPREDPRLLDHIDEIKANPDANMVMERLVAVQKELLSNVLVKGGFIQDPDLMKLTQLLQQHFEGFGIAWTSGKKDVEKRFERFPQGLDEKLKAAATQIEEEIAKARKAAADHLRLFGSGDR